jgi:hypothetical protein
VVDPTNKGKTKEHKVENKDHATNMDGEWVETMITPPHHAIPSRSKCFHMMLTFKTYNAT